jgi:hypothetical protein
VHNYMWRGDSRGMCIRVCGRVVLVEFVHARVCVYVVCVVIALLDFLCNPELRTLHL